MHAKPAKLPNSGVLPPGREEANLCAWRWMRRVAHVAWMAAWLLSTACASHSDRTKSARSALDAGKPREALRLFNQELGVESERDLPAKPEGNDTLILLDRAMVLQQLGEFELSSRDLQVADKAIELLDFNRSTTDEIARYVFSDDSGPYRAPFYEKLLINTLNMLNYLERGLLNGARIEARRLTVMQSFIENQAGEGASLLGPGSYLAGFVFEKSGQPREALRYYDEALRQSTFLSLGPAIRRLAAQASYRTPRIERVLAAHDDDDDDDDDNDDDDDDDDNDDDDDDDNDDEVDSPEAGEVLIVLSQGRVPAKVPKRVPIGLALTYAANALSPRDLSRANQLAAQGLVSWVNYPELDQPKPYGPAQLKVDGREIALEQSLRVDVQARKAWEAARGSIVASAITRLLSRVVAGETTKKATGGGLLGAVLSLGAQAALTARDVPDTRSWSTLPARILVARVSLPAGEHLIELSSSAAQRRARVKLEAGGWSVVALTELR